MNEQPPVSVGEIYEVDINSVGEKGDGIARVKGFVLFVPKTKKGDYVKIKITKVLKNVGFAEVVGKSVKESKFETVTEEEARKEEEEKTPHQYEETEDFGENF